MQYLRSRSIAHLFGQGTRMILRPNTSRLSRFLKAILVFGTVHTVLIFYWHWHSFSYRHPGSGIHLPWQNGTAESWNDTSPPLQIPTTTCSNYDMTKAQPDLSRNIGRLNLVQDSAWSKSKTDELINLRKLVLYSVHLLNKKTEDNPLCVKWWANPLTTWALSSVRLDSSTREWTLSFELEPGRIPVEVVIRQKAHNPRLINLQIQQELALISVRHLESPPLVSASFLDCMCSTGRTDAEQLSMAAREEWNRTDPEMRVWPPNASFIVSDYVDFLDHGHFLIQPGQFQNQNTDYCGPSVRIIVLIHSAPNNFEKRAAVRTTFGSRSNLDLFRARVVFFLGTVANRTLQKLIQEEAEEFDDLVQANFVDSYHNLTLKHYSVFQWIYLQCTSGLRRNSQKMPLHILKTDDDVVLNLESAIRVADANPDAGPIGPRHCGLVARSVSDKKAYTPRYMYAPDYFHGFLAGVAYVMRSDLIPQILQAALTTPMIPPDDSAILGRTLLRQINALPKYSALFSTRNRTRNLDPCFVRMMVVTQECEEGPAQMMTLWNKSLEPLPTNCSESTVNFMSTKRECPNRYVNDLSPSLKSSFRKIMSKYLL